MSRVTDEVAEANAKEIYKPEKPTIMADIILGIESSCDDTSAAVIKDGFLEIRCTKIGSGKMTLSASVGKDNETENGIGGMSYTRDISIASRPFATSNGGWL